MMLNYFFPFFSPYILFIFLRARRGPRTPNLNVARHTPASGRALYPQPCVCVYYLPGWPPLAAAVSFSCIVCCSSSLSLYLSLSLSRTLLYIYLYTIIPLVAARWHFGGFYISVCTCVLVALARGKRDDRWIYNFLIAPYSSSKCFLYSSRSQSVSSDACDAIAPRRTLEALAGYPHFSGFFSRR